MKSHLGFKKGGSHLRAIGSTANSTMDRIPVWLDVDTGHDVGHTNAIVPFDRIGLNAGLCIGCIRHLDGRPPSSLESPWG